MVVLGAGLGVCLALVEVVLARVWVQVLNGRQEGRAYLIGAGTSTLGLDERATVGLFGDSSVARLHAEIVSGPDGFALIPRDGQGRTRLNGSEAAGALAFGRRRPDRARRDDPGFSEALIAFGYEITISRKRLRRTQIPPIPQIMISRLSNSIGGIGEICVRRRLSSPPRLIHGERGKARSVVAGGRPGGRTPAGGSRSRPARSSWATAWTGPPVWTSRGRRDTRSGRWRLGRLKSTSRTRW